MFLLVVFILVGFVDIGLSIREIHRRLRVGDKSLMGSYGPWGVLLPVFGGVMLFDQNGLLAILGAMEYIVLNNAYAYPIGKMFVILGMLQGFVLLGRNKKGYLLMLPLSIGVMIADVILWVNQ